MIQHIRAVALLLESVKGSPSGPEIRKQQVLSLKHMFQSRRFTPAEAEQLAEALNSIQWDPVELVELQAELLSKDTDSLTGLSRRPLQDYTSMHNFMTTDVWDRLQSKERQQRDGLDVLLLFAIRLGLRCPTEATYQTIACIHMLAQDGLSNVQQMTLDQRLAQVRSVKSCFRNALNHAVDVLRVHVLRLDDLEEKHPDIWLQVFGDGNPVSSRITWQDLSQCMLMTPMRASRRASVPTIQIETPLATQAQNFASFMQSQMHQMQQMQTLTLHALHARQTTPVEPFEQGVDVQPALPMLEDRTPPRVEPIPSISEEVTPRTEREEVAEVTPTAAVTTRSSHSVGEATAALLKAMENRGSAKAQAKAQAKAKATGNKGSARGKASTKKPASQKTKVKRTAMKRKTTSKKATQTKTSSTKPGTKKRPNLSSLPSNAKRLQMRPSGCSRCRFKPGCTPSCFKLNCK